MDVIELIRLSPQGLSAGDIEAAAGGALSRPTINRRLREAMTRGEILRIGKGPSTISSN